MRSATRLTLVAAISAASAGCGNYSTEDLRFLAALPYREDLRVTVPAEGATAAAALAGGTALSACAAPGEATAWLDARRTSDGLNAGVDFVVGLIDAVRRYPPTARDDDYRRWGPFDAENHPGREIQIVMERSWPLGEEGPPEYAYRFEARWKDDPAFTPLIEGSFSGASAARGGGDVQLFFANFIALGMNDATTPDTTMTIAYDRASDPVTIDLSLTSGGFGVASFLYQFDGYADGSGTFKYRIVDAGSTLTVGAAWNPAKAGRARIAYVGAMGSGFVDDCWDASACLVYADDPYDVSCEAPPCSTPDASECVSDAPPLPAVP
jgi:hypothetical protein